MSQFFTQGAVPLLCDAYIQRAFEDEIFGAVTAGRWILLLGPRQHGKSTGLVRLNARFRGAGFDSALVDLQAHAPISTFSELLGWFMDQIGKSLGRSVPRPSAQNLSD